MTDTFLPTLEPQRRPPPPVQHRHSQSDQKPLVSEETSYGKGSPDWSQRLERKLAKYNSSHNVFKRWLLEIVCWTTSAICMCAIVSIYLRIDGHNMSSSAQLLGYASILAKVASASLIVPTSEALGQLKWDWFNKSNAMWDFEIFDKATRGPWGAALLLYRTKGQSLAALGALLIVLLLAIDTFFQQVATYPEQWVPSALKSEVPRMVQYEPFYTPEFMQGMETSFINPALRPVVGQFFIDNGTQPVPFGNGTRPDVPLVCPTGNCTWPEYETLAVCSKCISIPDLLDYACLSASIDWSADWTGELDNSRFPVKRICGYFLNAASNAPILMSGYIVDGNNSDALGGEVLLTRSLPLTEMLTKVPIHGGSLKFNEFRNPIIDALIVSAPDGVQSVFNKEKPVVHECVLAWCVQTMVSKYSSGVYNEDVTSTHFNTSTAPVAFPWESFPVTIDNEVMGNVVLYTQNIEIRPPPPQNGSKVITSLIPYTIGNTTVANVLQSFDDYFPSFYTSKAPYKNPPMLRYKNYLGGPALRELRFNPLLAPNNITRHMERLALAITNTIRSDAVSNESLQGSAFDKLQFVSIRWEWLIFPLALLLLSLVFLVSTITKTSKDAAVGVWKTSAMPTLIYGLPEEARSRFTESTLPNQEARKMRVKLLRNQGWRISGQSLLKSPSLAHPPR